MDYIGIIKKRKVIDGKLYSRYFVDLEGKEIGIPAGVYICKNKGIRYVLVRLNKEKYPDAFSVSTPYTDRVTQEEAYKRSIVIINALGKGNNRTTCSTKPGHKRVPLHPAFNVDLSEVPSGVCVVSSITNNMPILQISVVYFDPVKNIFIPKAIYVGTINNWKDRYPQKLKEAIALREDSLKRHNELTKVN